ncbi:MAG: cache domain-containing protein, partial [Spirochaetales bacterium]|nr:cache domain-containing protein [Spirochaetales bacterium]
MNGKNTLRFGIGRKIQIGVLIVVLLPMIIGGSVSYYIYRNQQKVSAIRNLRNFADECGRDISYYVNTQFEVTRLVANNDVFQGGDHEVIQKYIESIMELYPNFAVVSIIDPDGKIVANSQSGLIGVSRTDSDWFKETIKLKEGEILPLDAYRAETSAGAMVIGLNTPIKDKSNRDLIGILAIRLKVDYIIEKIKDLYDKTGYGRHTFLINSKGKILSSPDNNEILDPNHLLELFEVSDSLPRGETGILENMKYCEKELIHIGYALMGYNDFSG